MAFSTLPDEMNLILWRHADAEEPRAAQGGAVQADLARELTPRGRKQAERCAGWLRPRLPDDAQILCSPALRAVQTAQALAEQPRIVRALAPGASAVALLDAAGWPDTRTVVLVSHQPVLGQLASLLLTHQEMDWSVRKCGIWWLSSRRRGDTAQVVLRAVINPDLL